MKTNHQPWFGFPLARFVEMIDLAAVSVRTLPAPQLAAELEDLVTRCAEPGAHLAERLMRRIYEAETARRLPASTNNLQR